MKTTATQANIKRRNAEKEKNAIRGKIELPLEEPLYHTYHEQGSGCAALAANPSLRNWYLNHALNLQCSQQFYNGLAPIRVTVSNSTLQENPHFEIVSIGTRFTKDQTNRIIEELIREGYYVYFTDFDNYYLRGKFQFQKKHTYDSGMIFGFDRDNKTFSLYAYDEDYVYRAFQTPQKAVNAARAAASEKGVYGMLYGFRPKEEEVSFCPQTVIDNIRQYAEASTLRYPVGGVDTVRGIAVQRCVALYLDKLMEGAIPFEYAERGIFELLWEHKNVMLTCIRRLEQEYGLIGDAGDRYGVLVDQMSILKLLYRSCESSKDSAVLFDIREKVLRAYKLEQEVLKAFLSKFRNGVYVVKNGDDTEISSGKGRHHGLVEIH